MEQIKANLYPCAHCDGSGTCKNGLQQTSCLACINKNELKGKEHVGLVCGSCGGLGVAEPFTERLNNRIKPLLAMSIVFVMLIFMFVLALIKSPYFTEVLAFASTLIGGIVAYYFAAARRSS